MKLVHSLPESVCASEFVPSLGFRTGSYGERESYAAIIGHTTGKGVHRRWRAEGARFNERTPFETAVRIYRTIMRAGPHYVIGQGAECVQVCPEGKAAWHVGIGPRFTPWLRATAYRGNWSTPAHGWWHERWPGLHSPLDLAGGEIWTGWPPSCNDNTIGYEVVPPLDDPDGPWSPACWGKIVALIADIKRRRAIPTARNRILTHSDVHPLTRTSRGQPWDPSTTQWRWDYYRSKAGF